MNAKKDRHDEALLLLLGSIVEGSGQVQAAIGVILRWGLGATDAQGTPNRDNLLRELDDLKGAIRRLEKVLSPSQLTLGGPTLADAAKASGTGANGA